MIFKGICGMCQGGCHVEMEIENGILKKIRADKESPLGRLCIRGALAPEMLYDTNRIKHPLVRTGKRGDGRLRAVSWNEAFDAAAEAIKKTIDEYGARSVASYYGRGILGTPVWEMGTNTAECMSMLRRLGSPNDMSCSSICNTVSSMIAPVTSLGIKTSSMIQDVENSEYIISWGKNSVTDDGPQKMLRRIKAAMKRGAKLIVIDPRRSGLGEMADWWIPVIPGGDGALALAMLKIIVEGKKYDEEFVREYTIGFPELEKYLKSLSAAQLAEWCGISIDSIEKLCTLFCSTRKISLISYTGLEYQLSAVQNSRAMYTLWAITGKLDEKGGIYLDEEGAHTYELQEPESKDLPVGAREFPIFYKFTGAGQFTCIPKAVIKDDPYPVRGLMIIGGSPILSFPEYDAWKAAYEKLSCLVVIDRYLTEDTRYADVVLPSCSLFEVPRVVDTDGRPLIQEPLLRPVGEAMNDTLIVSEIAHRLGVGSGYPRDDTELRSWMLETAACRRPATSENSRQYRKYQTGKLREDGRPGFPTPSGKFEICSTYLKENGYTPYPEYNDIHSIPEFSDPKFSFVMTTGARSNNRMGVFGANISKIAEIEPYPKVDINAEDAAERGITSGDMVWVATPFGRKKFKADICGIKRHVIHIPHGGGSRYMPKLWEQGNANCLCGSMYTDPISGFPLIKCVPCFIEKVKK